ncbi:MAG: hypothetical protein RBU30_24980, partial [Polyangia bacterium]|nr:hypothetical protein [Polyangia bacterium]
SSSDGEKGKGKGKKGCPAAEVTVDGKVMPLKLPGLGVKIKGYNGYLIHAYTYEGNTCENALTGRGASIPQDGFSFRVSVVPGQVNTLGAGFYTHVGLKAKILDKPAKDGDTLSICIRKPTEFVPNIGDLKDKKVVAKGLFTAKFCGEMK